MAVARTTEEKAILFDGVSISVLALIFGKDKRDVSQKIREVKPSGMNAGFPVYAMKDVAPYLCDPVMNVEEYLSQLKPDKLPSQLQKDFWQAQLSRQKFEVNKGDLWDTDAVVAAMAEVFKRLKTTVLLFSDSVEARVGLDERQRKVILELSDALLVDLQQTLLEGKFDGDDQEEPAAALQELD
jgi:predicted transposase YdaD